jgi:membrane associated rhomboid family serine protease
MIPLKARVPVFRTPLVTWSLVAANVLVFLWVLAQGSGLTRTEIELSLIPQNLIGDDVSILLLQGSPIAAVFADREILPYDPRVDVRNVVQERGGQGRFYYRITRFETLPLETHRQELPAWMTIFTAMFMHAGWLHLIFNMWTLLVFGPSLEDSVGRLPYLLLYLACGVGATLAHVANDPHSAIPSLGASGAISGVMGGFALRFPGANVLTLIPIFLYTLAHLPAWVFMLIYLGEQIFMSIVHTQENGGVAWWAHIGGFAAGYILIRFFPIRGEWRDILRRRYGPDDSS